MNKINTSKEYFRLCTCLKYSSLGIFVVELNSKVVEQKLMDELRNDENIQDVDCVDFLEIQNDFVDDMRQREQSSHVVVYYNFFSDSPSFDIVRTMNLSREVIKNIGRVVFLFPSFLVNRIQYEVPNLRDYVMSFFDFRLLFDIPFEPVFAIDSHVFRTKQERYVLKHLGEERKAPDNPTVGDYFQYLSRFEHKKISDKDVQSIENYLWFVSSELHEQSKREGNEKIFLNLQEELWRTTGWVYARHRRYKEAIEIFDQIIILTEIGEDFMRYRLHSYEGKAYCYYHGRQFDKAKEQLLKMLELLDDCETDYATWKARILNDYACCFLREENYSKAMEILDTSHSILIESGTDNLNRTFRYRYNLMLTFLLTRKSLYTLLPDWRKMGQGLASQSLAYQVQYGKYCNMNAWIMGIECGSLFLAYDASLDSLKYCRDVFPENHIELARNHYSLAIISELLGDNEKKEFHHNKMRNIMNNTKRRTLV